MSFPVEKVRADFPVLTREVNGLPLAYLDSAASAQKPNQVVDAEAEFYRHGYAAVHRGIHTLSAEATQRMENVRTQGRLPQRPLAGRAGVCARHHRRDQPGRQQLGQRQVHAGITSSSPRWSTTPISCRGRCSASALARSCG
jgi:cysteine desulfurase/selenocysteine lyase